MKKHIFLPYFLLITIFISSCNRIKEKGIGVWEKSVDNVVDKTHIFEQYDYDKPDTENNLKGFKKHVQIEITDDIKNVYYFADELGADSKYQIGFNCDMSTIDKIISQHNLSNSNPSMSTFGIHYELDWWQVKNLTKLKPYWKTDKTHNYWFLWYDKEVEKAYFLTFDT